VLVQAALENMKDLPVSHGVMNTTVADRHGLDHRARDG
jgi:branched-chain amino acid transport system substrate-binding protein